MIVPPAASVHKNRPPESEIIFHI